MVYFIKAENRLKIGYAEDPSKRIPSIQTSSPFQLEVLLIIDGDYSVERDLHQRFQDFRVSGEWFEFNNEIKTISFLIFTPPPKLTHPNKTARVLHRNL